MCPACLLNAETMVAAPTSHPPGETGGTASGPPPEFKRAGEPVGKPEAPALDPKFAVPLARLRELFPDLEILDLLGAGGMGAVYRARQPRLNRTVALKVLTCPPEMYDDFSLRFEREAQVLARLNHPNIVTIYDFGEIDRSDDADSHGNLFYFVMEYVNGADLNQMIRTGELKPEQALAIVPQICDALQYANDEGITHRDIKPANILVGKKGRVRIADFGLAKLIGADSDALGTGLTLTGTSMGTPHYMAPEQWETSAVVDHRADIYSLGVVFYEMLTGQRPHGIFDPPSRKIQVDVRLDEVVLKAMDKDIDRRYQQASEVKDDVTRVVETPAPVAQPRKRTAANTTRAVAVIVMMIAVVLGGGWWWSTRPEPVLVPDKESMVVESDAVTSTKPEGKVEVGTGATGEPSTPSDFVSRAAFPAGEWVKVLNTQAEVDKALGGEKGQVQLREDGWLDGSKSDGALLRLGAFHTGQVGVRMRLKISDREPVQTGVAIYFKTSDDGKGTAMGHRLFLAGMKIGNPAVYVGHFEFSTKKSERLGSMALDSWPEPGDEFDVEFFAIADQLIARFNGQLMPIARDTQETIEEIQIQPTHLIRDVGFINLEGLSGAEMLKVAGVGGSVKAVTVADSAFPLPRPTRPSTGGKVVAWHYSKGLDAAPSGLAVFPAGLEDVVAIDFGPGSGATEGVNGETQHALALHADGRVSAWGRDAAGESQVPPNLKSAVAISAGQIDSVALHEDGTVTAWGNGERISGFHETVATWKDVVGVACGSEHIVALTSAGKVFAAGTDKDGNLHVPEEIQGRTTAVSVGNRLSLALLDDGTVRGWGITDRVDTDSLAAAREVAAIAALKELPFTLDQQGRLSAHFSKTDPSYPPERILSLEAITRLTCEKKVHPLFAAYTAADDRWHFWGETPGWESERIDELLAGSGSFTDLEIALPDFLIGIQKISPQDSAAVHESTAFPPSSLETPPGEPWSPPGSLHAIGTFPDTDQAIDLSAVSKFNDFVDVHGTPGRWVALRSNGETVSSDGKADRKGIRKIVRGIEDQFALITQEGRLVFPDDDTAIPIPEPVNSADIVDAAFGFQHGLALTAEGTAILCGSVYEGGSGWPMPGDKVLNDVAAVAAIGNHAATVLKDGSLHLWGASGPIAIELPEGVDGFTQIAAINQDNFIFEDLNGQIWRQGFRQDSARTRGSFISHGKGILKSGRFFIDEAGAWQLPGLTDAAKPHQKLLDEHVSRGVKVIGGYARGYSNHKLDGSWRGYIIWIEPADLGVGSAITVPSAVAAMRKRGGRLRAWAAAGSELPPGLELADGIDDFVQLNGLAVPGADRWLAIRAEGSSVTPLANFESSSELVSLDTHLGVLRSGEMLHCWKDQRKVVAGDALDSDVAGALPNPTRIILNRDRTVTLIRGASNDPWADDQIPAVREAVNQVNDAVQISANFDAAAVLRANGEVISWTGQDGLVIADPPITNAVEVECDGGGAWAALLADGSVRVWTKPGVDGYPPMSIPDDLGKAYAIRLGGRVCAAQMADGSWQAWGETSSGKVAQINSMGPAVDILLAPIQHKMFLWIEPTAKSVQSQFPLPYPARPEDPGTVIAVSFDPDEAASSHSPVRIPEGLDDVVAVDVAQVQEKENRLPHALALHADGRVTTWGAGVNDVLKVPDDLKPAVAITAFGGNQAGGHSAALHANGTVTVWGGWKDLIEKTQSWRDVVALVSAGSRPRLFALTVDGRIFYAAGEQDASAIPEAIQGRVVEIAAQGNAVAARLDDGTVSVWDQVDAADIAIAEQARDVKGVFMLKNRTFTLDADGRLSARIPDSKGYYPPARIGELTAVTRVLSTESNVPQDNVFAAYSSADERWHVWGDSRWTGSAGVEKILSDAGQPERIAFVDPQTILAIVPTGE